MELAALSSGRDYQDPGQSLLASIELDQKIRELASGPDELAQLLRKAKKLSISAEPWTRLNYPEALIDLSGAASLRALADASLTPKHTIFKPLRKLIAKGAAEASKLGSEEQDLLQQIVRYYRAFVEKVCAMNGKQRLQLLKGPARMQATSFSMWLPQKEARKMASQDCYGLFVKANAYGASAVIAVGPTHFKRSLGNPLNPGREYAVDALKRRMMRQGSAPTQVIKIENIWVKCVDSEKTLGHPLRKQLNAERYKQGKTVEQIFRESLTLKQQYPFELLRERVIVQVARTVQGTNFYDLLQTTSSQSIYIRNFTAMFFLEMVTGPGDARSDNFMYADVLTCIDNDIGLLPELVRDRKGRHDLGIRSILFLLPQMDERPDPAAVEYFLSLKPEEILIDWLDDLHFKNREYEKLLSEKVLTEREFEEISLPISFESEQTISRTFRGFQRVQAVLRKNPDSTHWEILEQVYPVLTPCLREIVKRAGGDPIKAQDILFGFSSQKPCEDPPQVEDLLSARQLEDLAPLLHQLSSPDEKQDIPMAMQSLLELIPTEKGILERVMPFQYLSSLLVHDSAVGDEDLVRTLRNMPNLKAVHLANCVEVTKAGVLRLLEDCPQLSLTLGNSAQISAQDLYDIAHFCWVRNRSLSFDLGEPVAVLPDAVDEGFRHALLRQDLTLAGAYLLLGADLDRPTTEGILLHTIAAKDCPASLDFLLQRNVKKDPQGKNKQTPLHFAAQGGFVKNIELLLADQHDKDARDIEWRTPLQHAVSRGHVVVADALVGGGASLATLSSEQQNLFHFAASSGSVPMLEWVLEKAERASLTKEDSVGKQPIHYAVLGSPKPDVVALMLKRGARASERDQSGNTPLHFAGKYGHIKSFHALLASGGDPTLTNFKSQTAWDVIIQYGQDNLLRSLINPCLELDKGSAPAPTHNPKEQYQVLLDRALQEKNVVDQVLYLEKLGELFLTEESYIDAALHVNAALAVSQGLDSPYSRHLHDFLFRRLERIEWAYVSQALSKKIPSDYQDYIRRNRANLREYRARAEQLFTKQGSTEEILSTLTEGYMRVLAALTREALEVLGSSPSSFTVFGMGPLALGEVCPHSSLQLGILIGKETPETGSYFTALMKLLHLKVINMGETHLKISSMDHPEEFAQPEERAASSSNDSRAENSRASAQLPSQSSISLGLSGFCLDVRGSVPVETFVGTPSRLAQYQHPSSQDIELACALRTVCPVFETDRTLIGTYQNEIKKIRREKTGPLGFTGAPVLAARGLELLRGCIARLSFQPDVAQSHLGFELSRELTHPLRDILEGLSLVFGLKNPSSIGKIREMVETKPALLTQRGGERLATLYMDVLRLQTDAHLHYRGANDRICHPKLGGMDIEGSFKITDNVLDVLRNAYRVLFPLLKAIQVIVDSKGAQNPLKANELYLADFGTEVPEHLRFLIDEDSSSSS